MYSEIEDACSQSEMPLHANGSSIANGYATPEVHPSNWVPVLDQCLFARRKLKIICIGAGFAGLTLAHKIKHGWKISDVLDLTIYEKNEDVGGTWFENVYPGVGCDIPAHAYSFPFEPNPNWSRFYCSGQEIEAYIKKTAEKYGLKGFINFNSAVVETIWDEDAGKWKVKIDQQGRIIDDEADVLVSAAGILNKWKWPDIEGLHHFTGKLMHSARWDTSYDYTGKRIAVIGNGSSAIQIVSAVQPAAARLVDYIRQPTWISGNFCADVTGHGQNFSYTDEEKQMYANDPEAFLAYRKRLDASVNAVYSMHRRDSPLHHLIANFTQQIMQSRLQNSPDLAAKMIPTTFPVGCRRLTPGDGYLEALQQSNAHAEFSPIRRITATGIETEAGSEDFDLIVCATGFDVSWKPGWKMIGRSGDRVDQSPKDNLHAYFGVCTADLPNYFMFNGPNGPNGHGSIMALMGWVAEYILKWCEKIAIEDIKSVVVRQKALDDYVTYSNELLKRTVWSGSCRSWYKDGKKDGEVGALYGGSLLHWKVCMNSIRGEDFEIRYNSPNMFRFMGNGYTELEANGGDLSYYMER